MSLNPPSSPGSMIATDGRTARWPMRRHLDLEGSRDTSFMTLRQGCEQMNDAIVGRPLARGQLYQGS